ncbi:hypothetical protein F4821DRAFT_279798 [Hypoxylon rubiginosum]|uniref:Uncharacterized protein n=1 Tax=Hypoxylon rubiginosum TaxID=110542 RepID=A0ACC0CWM5_9PEZI|nr:hypothetical protein F4821DRAFT_279798 [Hypoxylon rubiginosum]
MHHQFTYPQRSLLQYLTLFNTTIPSKHHQPSDLRSDIMSPQVQVRSQNESTLAYDSPRERQGTLRPNSMSTQETSRVIKRIPEVEHKDTKWAKFFGNFLGKPKEKPSSSHEKLSISEPRLISAPSHVRAGHQPAQQTPAPKRVSRILSEVNLPKPPSKSPRIQRENLGTAREALGSQPIGSWLNRMEKQCPAQQILLTASRRQSNQSKSAPENAWPLTDVVAQTSADIKAERRKGRIFLDSDLSRNLYEFPDPEEWYDDSDDDSDDSRWEDAGFDDGGDDDDTDDADNDGTIPNIIISEPCDNKCNENATQRNRMSKRHLDIDDCYKVLWTNQDKELRQIKRCLLPLAYLIAEVENIDLDNPELLEGTLKSIIADRERLFDLYPLAYMLAQDQGIDAEDFAALPQVLDSVFQDRDNAKKMVRYHKATKEKLERRVAEMENERKHSYEDAEEYVRM